MIASIRNIEVLGWAVMPLRASATHILRIANPFQQWYNLRRLRTFLRYTSIAILTIFFLGLFLWKSNLHEVGRILGTTNLAWLAIALFINWLTLAFRTIRWRLIIDPIEPPPFYPTYFANAAGYMLSTILPIRAGDVARPALLARRTKVRFATALGTVLTERILDLASILIVFLIFAVRRWDQYSHDPTINRWFFAIRSGTIVSVLILGFLAGFVAGLFFFRESVRRAHSWLGDHLIPKRFRESWMQFFDSFANTLDLANHPGALLRVMLCTAGIWLCLTSQFYFTVLALNRPLPFDSSFFVNGVTTVGLAVPTPGGVGGFHKACQIVLTTFYHFDIDSSVAVALLFHVVGTLPVIVTGLLLFVREGLNWRQLSAEARQQQT
ncbi:MAG TPA: lysylphosphatidylglycerol synthase transmembrane domain-containing protein [Thermoanaerobaculia bacterium]|nr:lysylphosphatidylglycerol synthase transmembrane domain-containing protein [Thermoanaerobaculia bacterium]